ncbi:MAG: tRNA uridine(34) 5-carboxymethylaminomethyl modification radical SAM/GNAT enzyme Elp3 [Thermoplasmata archaeon]|nr:tRNA uridine(34) 5-carboxymethylaminomethyl modification radical SAM/GNAT enzyme Elp3 [Thermoplasmata archaeon]MCI4362609.1 tRNA uridine(34) 5-carboxymethylaminomethyl modification radical SAM/GNAT enzyme Elp3 [Thermoplasmata archaeon]
MADALSSDDRHRAKLRYAKAAGVAVPSNVVFAEGLSKEQREAWTSGGPLRKPTRTLSGVAVVAVMTAPAACPHGRCTYCPGGLERGTPQSYTGEEPSALRGAQFQWDARAITAHRLAALDAIGHPTSKVEVILMGGTFPSRPQTYQGTVIRGVFEALNGTLAGSLAEAHSANETAPHRCVSLTVETRPDWCDDRVLPWLLDAGVTRVELGVECLTDPVLRAVNRAHRSDDVANATRSARDSGLKVAYHWMLGLPGMDPAKDLADFRKLFDDPTYRPDMLKIYPTLVVPGTPLHDDWERGAYQPYDTETAAELIAEMKRSLPPWVRIQRIQRDIPARLISAGVRAGNLRELALRKLAERGERCRCLRCREPGRRASPDPERFRLQELRYQASQGTEWFLSFDDPETDTVAGFLRLRAPSSASPTGLRDPVVRELKVLGPETPIGVRPGPGTYQHRGFGRALLDRAESIAREEGARRVFVTAAVGTRPYYRALGYERVGAYVAKPLFA